MFIKRIGRFFGKGSGHFEQFQSIKARKLEDQELNSQLKNLKLDDWKYDKNGNRISKRVCMKDMKNNSSELLQSINGIAQRMGLKPDYVTGYEYVEVSLSTNDLKGVSQKDLGLASAIDRLERAHRAYCKEPKHDYKCELKPEDEREIYNAVSVRLANPGHDQSHADSHGKEGSVQGGQHKGSSYEAGKGSCGTSSHDHKDNKTGADGYNYNQQKSAKGNDTCSSGQSGSQFKQEKGACSDGKTQDHMTREQTQKINARQNQEKDSGTAKRDDISSDKYSNIKTPADHNKNQSKQYNQKDGDHNHNNHDGKTEKANPRSDKSKNINEKSYK